MLRGIQRATSNWIGRIVTGILLGLIAISFAVWGIADVFRSGGRTTVAKIGDTEIGIEQFRQTFTERLQQISRRAGRTISPDQARALGLDRQILGQTLAESAIDQRAASLRLRLPDTEVAKRIRSESYFQGPAGQFDRNRFEQIIRSSGYTEGRYVAEQRRVMVRRQLVETISSEIPVPSSLLDAQVRFQNENRSIEYVILGAEQAGQIPQPTPDELLSYYQQQQGAFRAPEYRKLVVVALTPDTIAKSITVSEDDARKAYEQRRDSFGTPEKREVLQIVFPNAGEAQAAADRIKGGVSFAALATERNIKDSDFNLGLITKSEIIDRAVADAAFALKANEVSAPITGSFGATLVQVNKIEPEKLKPFQEVAADLKRDLALEQARARLARDHDKYEDDRASGQTVAEAAQKLGLQVINVEGVDRSGRDLQGNPLADVPGGTELVTAAFASDVGVESDPLQIPGGGYIWYEVAGITPSRERTFEEVKDRVAATYRNEKVAEILKTKATELQSKLGTQPFNDALAPLGLKSQTVAGLKRGAAPQNIPAKALPLIFSTAKGAVNASEGSASDVWIVFRVTDIAIPETVQADATKRLMDAARTSIGEELMTQYVTRIQNDLGTSINQSGLNQATGASSNTN